MCMTEAVRRRLASAVVASIGPTTSEELRQRGIRVDVEASHPKMGFLAREAAEAAATLDRQGRHDASAGARVDHIERPGPD